jgi:hypothetical protein
MLHAFATSSHSVVTGLVLATLPNSQHAYLQEHSRDLGTYRQMNQPSLGPSRLRPALGQPRSMHLVVLVLMHEEQSEPKHRLCENVKHGVHDGLRIRVDAPRALTEREDDGVYEPEDQGVDCELGVEPRCLGVLVLST